MTEPTRLTEADLERLLAHVEASSGISVYTVGESYAFQQTDILTPDVVRALVEEVRRLRDRLDALAALRPTVLYPITRYCEWYEGKQPHNCGDVVYEAVSALRQVLALLPEEGR